MDTGSALYVWVGRGATQQEKSQAIVRAQSMCIKKMTSKFSQKCKYFGKNMYRNFRNFSRLYSIEKVPIMDTGPPNR